MKYIFELRGSFFYLVTDMFAMPKVLGLYFVARLDREWKYYKERGIVDMFAKVLDLFIWWLVW